MGRRILVVDNDPDFAESLAWFVSLEGHAAFFAYDGPTALKMVQEVRPHVVLLDLAMPGMDGDELAWRIRQLPNMKKALLICVSGSGRTDARQRALDAGCDQFLLKPVNMEELFALLREGTSPLRAEPMPGAERCTTRVAQLIHPCGTAHRALGSIPAQRPVRQLLSAELACLARSGCMDPLAHGLSRALSISHRLVENALQVCAAAKDCCADAVVTRRLSSQLRLERVGLVSARTHPVGVARSYIGN